MFNQEQIEMMSKSVADAVGQTLLSMGKQLDNEAEALEQSGVFTKEAGEDAEPIPAEATEAEPNAEIAELREVVEVLIGAIEAQKAEIAGLKAEQKAMQKALGIVKEEKVAKAKPSWAKSLAFRLGGNSNGINGAVAVEENDPIMKSKPVEAVVTSNGWFDDLAKNINGGVQ